MSYSNDILSYPGSSMLFTVTKKVAVLRLPTKILLFVSKILPRGMNIALWEGELFEKYK